MLSVKAVKKERYRLDLAALQGVCAANYLGMLKLFPQMREQSERSIMLDGNGMLELQVLERGPYTTLLAMYELAVSEGPVAAKSCQVKVYHDVRLAEVVAWGKVKKLKGRYHYPNEHMHQEDEKWQMNRFLGEWIRHCLEQGRSDLPGHNRYTSGCDEEQLEQ